MRLYIVRHADPDYENHTITRVGHLEAQALARRLAGESINRIVCSPSGRARETMRYTAEMLEQEPDFQEWLKELPWDYTDEREGEMMVWNLAGEVVRAREAMPGQLTWHKLPALRNHNFDTRFEELKLHSDAFLESLGYKRAGGRYQRVAPTQDRVAVFCHGGLAVNWIAHLLELPPPLLWCGFWLAPSSVTVILMEERSEEFAVPRCLALGDTSHLYEARLPVRPHGLLGNYF